MGGASYDRSVYSSGSSSSSGGFGGGGSSSSRSPSRSGFSYSQTASQRLNESTLNASLFPEGRNLVCNAKTGIVIMLDVTGSMGDAAKTIYDKMPMFYAQIEKKKYLDDFAISFAGVGDINTDSAPLQVCDFAQGVKLDKWLEKLYLEGNGGGQGMESYELMALYYLRHAQFTHPEATKPFMFIIGDEAFYDTVSGSDVKAHFGGRASAQDLAAEKIFDDLREKYHVFMLHIPYSCTRDPSDPKGELVQSRQPAEDKAIVRKWKEIFREDFIVVKEPKAIVDVILGCIAMAGKTRTLGQYLDDMKGRDQTKRRIDRVKESLQAKSDALALRPQQALAAVDRGLDRSRGSQRL